MSDPAVSQSSADLDAVEKLKSARLKIVSEIEKIIVGQTAIIDQLLITLFARGHCLLVGVPGLAKTKLISTLARILDLKFNRIQFTPDLMPSDITGTEIIEEDRAAGKRTFRFMQGPIFANIVLADEINRTPPKTQAALLQAMQEHEVTAGGTTFKLKEPFFVFATQNPIEQEGTYPLPEAQLDRFMFNLYLDYPGEKDEMQIVRSTTSAYEADVKTVLGAEDIIAFQQLIRGVPVSDYIIEYAVNLVRKTRPHHSQSPDFVKKWVRWGGGPRASQYLILGAKTRAVLHGRLSPSREDVDEVLKPVLRHRVLTNFNAEAEGVGAMEILERLLKENNGKKD